MNNPKERIINCHSHIFTGDHVPPWLAKTFVPGPMYLLFSLHLIVKFLRWYYAGPYTWQFKPWFKKIVLFLYEIKMLIKRAFIPNIIANALGILITLHVINFLSGLIPGLLGSFPDFITKAIQYFKSWLFNHNMLFPVNNTAFNLLAIFLLLFFVKWGRNLIIEIFKKVGGIFSLLPGKQSIALAKRYYQIGQFSKYNSQEAIFEKLKNQYPEGSGFIILPMDMEYMNAGMSPEKYEQQMLTLAGLKNKYRDILFPFIFADPRRIEKDKHYLKYHNNDGGRVELEDCFVKTYLEKNKFSGIKIYPALGYYPFDEKLLPLWKYAAENNIPIITHCIRGTIYYRGKKKKTWDSHPIFKGVISENEYAPLLMPEMKNSDFINNFTHPLNYLCLLDETLLRQVVNDSSIEIKNLFGYIDANTPLVHNLSNLKICFGHFGGDDEWNRFMESDRDQYSSQVIKYPDEGIFFLHNRKNEPTPGKPEQIWKYVDWYSIICSLILQYPNVYADISYILQNDKILPLLKQTLQNNGLRKKVLYGTDFYVVRNHKSDKNMLADMIAGLSEDEFDQIARENPKHFLRSDLLENMN